MDNSRVKNDVTQGRRDYQDSSFQNSGTSGRYSKTTGIGFTWLRFSH